MGIHPNGGYLLYPGLPLSIHSFVMVFDNRMATFPAGDWEYRWAPYDQPTYHAVLEQLKPDDIVLEIGAGDLRLARQMATIVRRVYAVEINAGLLDQSLGSGKELPENLVPIHADARRLDFPADVGVGVLLMRHCTHFRLYAGKLKALGCQSLITNARWRMGVEAVSLQASRIPFRQVRIGWCACWCGATGFKSGPVEELSPETEAIIYEVVDCPNCSPN